MDSVGSADFLYFKWNTAEYVWLHPAFMNTYSVLSNYKDEWITFLVPSDIEVHMRRQNTQLPQQNEEFCVAETVLDLRRCFCQTVFDMQSLLGTVNNEGTLLIRD